MKYYVACKETGDFICEVANVNEGLKLIKKYEAEDRKNGDYSEDFYDVVNEEHCSVEYLIPLKVRREKAGLSQSQLADKAGVNIRMIQFYEQGVKDINKAEAITVLKLAKALDCKMEDLIG